MWALIGAALLTLLPLHGWQHIMQVGLVGVLALGAAVLIVSGDD